MADCHDLFDTFHGKILLPSSKKDYLKQSRDALRKRIKKYFREELKLVPPGFWIQGSYAMATIINPLGGEYDIDDGVYLQGLDPDRRKWPSPDKTHKWVYNAVKGHTDKEPEDKGTCIRVIYSGQYHVDLPIYGINNGVYYLAEKGEAGWNESNPKDLTNWFNKRVSSNGEQLRKIVRYIKAWADYKEKGNSKLPSGLLLTVLVADHFESRERDDAAFSATITNIYSRISNSFIVPNPVNPNEILSDRLTGSQKTNFKNLTSKLYESADKALKEDDKKKASEIWQKEFGDRFPVLDDSDEGKGALFTSAPAILKNDARSA